MVFMSENSDCFVRFLYCFMQVDLHLPRLNFLRYDWYMPLVLSRENCVTH